MSEHTPGPWKDEVNGDIFGPLGELIGFISYPERMVSAANARLIAAAPNLLEACRQYVKHYDNPAESLSTSALMAGMREAIAKAEGR